MQSQKRRQGYRRYERRGHESNPADWSDGVEFAPCRAGAGKMYACIHHWGFGTSLQMEAISMTFRNFVLLPASLFLMMGATAAFGQGAPKSAHADIVNAQGESI